MAGVVGGVAVGWAVCHVSLTAEPRTRLALAGAAVLGTLALQCVVERIGTWISGGGERRQNNLMELAAKRKGGKITYAKSKFEAAAGAPPRVIVAATGSVATVKVPEIVVGLRNMLGEGAELKVLLSACGEKMLEISEGYNSSAWGEMKALGVEVITDPDEWVGYENVRKDSVVHIELRRWADCVVVAPCSAHTLAKIALGLSDNLLSSMIRAWDPLKPLIVAPAMNTVMWEHPATKQHLNTLVSWGYHIIPPVSKLLACNEYGNGALADVKSIVEQVSVQLEGHQGRRANSGVGSWQRLGFEEWKLCVSDC